MEPEEKGKVVASRTIEMNTYDLGEHQVLVEGRLRDTRLPPVPIGEQPGKMILLHNLVARIWVRGPDLTIYQVEAQMDQIPREPCPEALPGIQKLVGLKIFSGFTMKVKQLIGGARGCSHLANLFLTLGPAAVQGYFAAYGRKPGSRTLDNPAFSRIVDSCHVWRKDGPLARSLAEGKAKGVS